MGSGPSIISGISAVTFAISDMVRSVQFYKSIGFELIYGGQTSEFSSFRAAAQYLNLTTEKTDNKIGFGGRVIFHVDDVDGMYHHMTTIGLTPEFEPRDATWGERYFHITDPDGHDLSFARPLERNHSSLIREMIS